MVNWNKVFDYLQGTCKSPSAVIEFLDLDCDENDVEEAMLDLNLEICPHCGWWTESCELVDDECNVVGCEQCRPSRQED